jgi:hypothetical protein
LYVCEGIQRKRPDIRTVKREIPNARGESDGGGGTPSDMIDANLEGYIDTI